jgi:peptidoglycan/xylan/chitin deacetylase (PgdA/CDA1 family)
MIRNPIPWPNGASCAVCFSFDLDADSYVHLAYPQDADNRLHSLSIARYGPEVAVPRLVDLFERTEIPSTFFTPGWVIERYPAAVEAILKGGHELAHHGYLHHNPVDLTPEQEREAVGLGIDIIKRVSGRRPRGYRAPSWGVSRNTIRYLIDEGFDYESSLFGDDIPYLLTYGNRTLVEIPTAHGLDDWPHYMNWRDFNYFMPISAPARAMEVFGAEFEAAWTYGGLWVSVWHPHVSGRLARCHAIESLITHMQSKGGVWFARMEEISAHVRSLVESGRWTPRIDQLPYYDGPIPELMPDGKPRRRVIEKAARKPVARRRKK